MWTYAHVYFKVGLKERHKVNKQRISSQINIWSSKHLKQIISLDSVNQKRR